MRSPPSPWTRQGHGRWACPGNGVDRPYREGRARQPWPGRRSGQERASAVLEEPFFQLGQTLETGRQLTLAQGRHPGRDQLRTPAGHRPRADHGLRPGSFGGSLPAERLRPPHHRQHGVIVLQRRGSGRSGPPGSARAPDHGRAIADQMARPGQRRGGDGAIGHGASMGRPHPPRRGRRRRAPAGV